VVHVNILQRVKSDGGWKNRALPRDKRGRLQWPSGGRYLIEWRESGRRLREAAGDTPADALEAQKRKRLELEAAKTGVRIVDESEPQFPLSDTIERFLALVVNFETPALPMPRTAARRQVPAIVELERARRVT